VPNPFDNPELYDTITLNGVNSPGVCVLSGHDRSVKWDEAAAKGQDGSTATRGGEPLAHFTATFFLCKDLLLGFDEFEAWESFQALIESSTNGKNPIALAIYHPDLARNRITSVCNEGVGGLVHDGKGGATVVVHFIEYRPPKKKPAGKATAGSANTGAQAGTHKIGKPDPNAAAKAELEALLQEAQAP
jgi:hypothetical protein